MTRANMSPERRAKHAHMQRQAVTMTRNTTIRDRHRAAIARTKPPCAICGQPIDFGLPHLDPGAYVVDHIVPLAAGGPDTLANKQAAHRACNRDKADKAHGTIIRRSTTLTL